MSGAIGGARAVAPAPATASASGARIVGVDLARCLAIVGMLAAHLGYDPDRIGGEGGWVAPFDGRSSALFAVLAGVSIAIITRRADAEPGGWARSRIAIGVRGLVLIAIGLVLVALDTPIAIILPSYGVMFVLLLPLVRLPSPVLAVLAGVSVTLGSVVVLFLRWTLTGDVEPGGPLAAVEQLVLGYYPALAWIGYLLAGMVAGRAVLRSDRVAAPLIGIGAALAVVGYGSGSALAAATDADTFAFPGVLASTAPHADAPFELIGNLGVAFAAIGACVLITRFRTVRMIGAPFIAAGSMSLTIYVAQIIVIRAMGDDAVFEPESNGPFLTLAIASILAAWAWRTWLGRGPLERLLSRLSGGSRRAAVAAHPQGSTP